MAGPEVFGSNPYHQNRPVPGEIVTVLRGVTDRRGLQLEAYRSRAVIAGEVHELMTTNQPQVAPGDRVDDVALIGFFVVNQSGVLLVGSRVMIGGQPIGTIAGFDDTHMPNHQNICIQVETLQDGASLDLSVGEVVEIHGVEAGGYFGD